MEEKNRKKLPWKKVALAAAIISGAYLLLHRILLAFGMVLSSLRWIPGESASIGIIGGADGPTAVFVTGKTGTHWDLIIMAAVLLVSILAFLRLRKCKQK